MTVGVYLPLLVVASHVAESVGAALLALYVGWMTLVDLETFPASLQVKSVGTPLPHASFTSRYVYHKDRHPCDRYSNSVLASGATCVDREKWDRNHLTFIHKAPAASVLISPGNNI